MRNARWIPAVVLLMMGVVSVAWAGQYPYTTQTKTATVTTAATDVALWTPLSGSRFALQGCFFSSEVAVAIELEVSDVDVIPPVYLESYGDTQVGGNEAPIYTSATDAVLRYTVTYSGNTPYTGARVSLLCWGYEYRQG